jgi:acyl-CoA thioesterase FadM
LSSCGAWLEFLIRKPNGEVAAEVYVVIVAIGRKDSRSVTVPQALLDALAPYRADGSA